MEETYTKYKEALLNNNCPECYAAGALLLSFSQKHEEGVFFKRSTTDIKSDIICQRCNTPIYPARWNEDIERVYQYNLKLATVPKTYFKAKTPLIILSIGIPLVIAGLVYLVVYAN